MARKAVEGASLSIFIYIIYIIYSQLIYSQRKSVKQRPPALARQEHSRSCDTDTRFATPGFRECMTRGRLERSQINSHLTLRYLLDSGRQNTCAVSKDIKPNPVAMLASFSAKQANQRTDLVVSLFVCLLNMNTLTPSSNFHLSSVAAVDQTKDTSLLFW